MIEDYIGKIVRVNENPLGCPRGVYRVAGIKMGVLHLKGVGYIIPSEYVELDPKVSFWDRVRGYIQFSPL